MITSTANIVINPVKAIRSATVKGSVAVPASQNEILLPESLATAGSLKSSLAESPPLDERKKHNVKSLQVGGGMVLGVAAGVGGFLGSFSKGFLLDTPLAFAEGMRNVPNLYGGQVADYGNVTDWKSGLLVSGKSITLGIGEGFYDLFREPARGARKGGVLGGVVGVGKGFVGFCTKVFTGTLGLAAYPGLGLYKSIRRATHTKTRERIEAARREEMICVEV